jgi:hypothetical protein
MARSPSPRTMTEYQAEVGADASFANLVFAVEPHLGVLAKPQVRGRGVARDPACELIHTPLMRWVLDDAGGCCL